jgi:hypothetical protein
MSALIDVLTSLLPQPLSVVVHIGAGAFALDDYASLKVQHLVLVEGDPDAGAELAAQAQHSAYEVDVVTEVVAPKAGPVLWHRYNVRSLNGPRSAEPLRSVYPRLIERGQLSLPAVGFGTLLDRWIVTVGDGGSRVLILDVPGQEAPLLAAVPPERLQAFDWIVCAGCTADHGEGWCAAEAATRTLRTAHFAPADSVGSDALWPVSVWHLDRHALQLTRLQGELAAERDALEQARQEMHSTLAAQASERRIIERRADDLAAEVARLHDVERGQQDRVAELERQLQAATAERGVIERRADDLAAEVARLHDVERGQQDRVAELEARVRELTQESESLREDAAQRWGSLGGTLPSFGRATRAGQPPIANDELTQLRLRQRLMDEEMIKAEGQIELIRDILLREPGL